MGNTQISYKVVDGKLVETKTFLPPDPVDTVIDTDALIKSKDEETKNLADIQVRINNEIAEVQISHQPEIDQIQERIDVLDKQIAAAKQLGIKVDAVAEMDIIPTP